MTTSEIVLLALGLSVDSFAVAAAIGAATSGPRWRAATRTAAVFTVCQATALCLGWVAGRSISAAVHAAGAWAASTCLAVVALRLLYEARVDEPEKMRDGRWALLALGVATSIDSIAAGAALSLQGEPLAFPLIATAAATLALASVGCAAGHALGARSRRGALVAGAMVLLALAARIAFA